MKIIFNTIRRIGIALIATNFLVIVGCSDDNNQKMPEDIMNINISLSDKWLETKIEVTDTASLDLESFLDFVFFYPPHDVGREVKIVSSGKSRVLFRKGLYTRKEMLDIAGNEFNVNFLIDDRGILVVK